MTLRVVMNPGSPLNTVPCVNLKETFPSCRLDWDESDISGHRDPWYMELPGRDGKVYPYGHDLLGAMLYARHGKLRKRLEALGEATQAGDQECAIRFEVEAYKPVFALLKIRRRRVSNLTEAQKAEIGARLARGRRLTHGLDIAGDSKKPDPDAGATTLSSSAAATKGQRTAELRHCFLLDTGEPCPCGKLFFYHKLEHERDS